MEDRYQVIGVMSGSSLDGMDFAWCEFVLDDDAWSFSLSKTRSIPYSAEMRARLVAAMDGTALDLARLHRDLGDTIGKECAELLQNDGVDLLASHGHTLFHRPDEGLTMQIGCGARIAAHTGMTTVCDFRTKDVAHSGQGAPFVPLGEKLLFPNHNAFVNIGGICNIALHREDKTTGYDVCIGNQALNWLAEKTGKPYDENGNIARSGAIDPKLLDELNGLPFHYQAPPRSLGRDWFTAEMLPLLETDVLTVEDRMRTVVEHIAIQIASSVDPEQGPLLITGGGTHNEFLMERIRDLSPVVIEVPEATIIDFKEAIVFALLGVLRLRGEVNCLASVTGAQRNTIGGAVYLPN